MRLAGLAQTALLSAGVVGAAVASLPDFAALNTITSLASFTGTIGAFPEAALIAGPGGILYGITERGGTNSAGTVSSTEVVPGPLPILGAGMVFGWSRKLLARIRSSQRNVSTKT